MDIADAIDVHGFELIARREAALRPAPAFTPPAPVDRPPLVIPVPERLLRLSEEELAGRVALCWRELNGCRPWHKEHAEFVGFLREYVIEQERRKETP
jgi:hypothetical protein